MDALKIAGATLNQTPLDWQGNFDRIVQAIQKAKKQKEFNIKLIEEKAKKQFNANVKPNGNSEVALAEDSFGNVGEIQVSSGDQTSSITSPEEVLEVSDDNEVVTREKTNDEKEEEKSVSDILIKSSKIDETNLTI